jgi:hypothetical protein
MSAVDQEKLAIGWTLTAVLAYMANVNTIILMVLLLQTIISIIASIIISYREHGTKKHETGSKATSRRRNNKVR